MGKKEERTFTRQELADYLAVLSEQVRRGGLEAGGRRWPVPDRLSARIGIKEEDGAVAVKMSWQWSIREAPQGVREKPSFPPAQGPAPAQPASFKDLKVRLGATFKNLQRRLGEGQLPDPRLMADLVEGSRRLAEFAPPEWRQSMSEYLTHLENLQRAVESRLLEEARREAQNLAGCMTSCHKEFK
jgi:XXXCH domain-containing protein